MTDDIDLPMDREVRVQVDIDDWVTGIPCEAVEVADVPGFLVLLEPIGLTPNERANFAIDGDDALVVSLNDVVGIEGPLDAIGPFLPGDDDG